MLVKKGTEYSPWTWWRHHMETLSTLLALCEGNPSFTGGFPSQSPVVRNSDVFLIYSWTNGCTNNGVVGYLRRYGIWCHCTGYHFYQTRSAWSVDQGSNKNHSPAYNFAPTVTKFCVMWEGLSLPPDTKFGNCRCKIVDSRSFPSWSLIHGLRWSGLIKVVMLFHLFHCNDIAW